jgi:hypothetical protein
MSALCAPFEDLPHDFVLAVVEILDDPTSFSFQFLSRAHYKLYRISNTFFTFEMLIDYARGGFTSYLKWLFSNFGYFLEPCLVFPRLVKVSLKAGVTDLFEFLYPKRSAFFETQWNQSIMEGIGKSGKLEIVDKVLKICEKSLSLNSSFNTGHFFFLFWKH